MHFGLQSSSIALLLLLVAVACAPKGGNMQVAFLRGNAAYGMTQDKWDYGETKECQLASRSSQPPGPRGDVLVCGSETELAWNSFGFEIITFIQG